MKLNRRNKSRVDGCENDGKFVTFEIYLRLIHARHIFLHVSPSDDDVDNNGYYSDSMLR